MFDIFQYYGVDWAAFVSTIAWIYYVGEKKSIAFLFGGVASVMWLLFGYFTQSIASMIANSVFIGLQVQGYLKWKKDI